MKAVKEGDMDTPGDERILLLVAVAETADAVAATVVAPVHVVDLIVYC